MKAGIQAEVRPQLRTTEERTVENIGNNRRRSIRILASSRLIGCMLLLSLVSAAGAQQKTARPIHPRQHTVHRKAVEESEIDSLSKKLKLTDAQRPRVQGILGKKDEQIKRVTENQSLQRADNRYKKYRKLAEIHDKYRAKIRKLLTDEQKAKFDKVDLRT
jgi:Spy/CpxP family protein refolding chaperone